jgi:hypothetical protein
MERDQASRLMRTSGAGGGRPSALAFKALPASLPKPLNPDKVGRVGTSGACDGTAQRGGGVAQGPAGAALA